ncbi:MAG: NAD(P)H-dependent oxidoreductase [Acidimicrobiales bacterium]
MQVLVVDGFEPGQGRDAIDQVTAWISGAGHQVRPFPLAQRGFDACMTAAEREAYHTDEPLITPEARAAADAVLAADAIVICYPIVHGTAPARVKSWQERVFVLGLAFRFAPSGRITGALDHLHRALVLGVASQPTPGWRRDPGRRNAFGPCLARSFFLSSNRTCRSRYVTLPTGADRTRRLIGRWPVTPS